LIARHIFGGLDEAKKQASGHIPECHCGEPIDKGPCLRHAILWEYGLCDLGPTGTWDTRTLAARIVITFEAI
jgi:hypothetical protein